MNYQECTNEELIYLSRKGDELAEDYLIKKNMKLVHKAINKFKGSKYEKVDLFSYGQMGLFKAYRLFDPERNIKFSTYATHAIKREIWLLHQHHQKGIRKGSALSMNETVIGNGEIDLTIEETLHSNEVDYGFMAAYNEALSKFQKKATELQKRIFKLTVQDQLNRREVGEIVGLTHQSISHHMKKIRDKYFLHLAEN